MIPHLLFVFSFGQNFKFFAEVLRECSIAAPLLRNLNRALSEWGMQDARAPPFPFPFSISALKGLA